MILSQVRTFIRDRLIELGYEEWTTSINNETLPANILERSFHVSILSGSAGSINQAVLRVNNSVRLTVWRKGFNRPVEAQDACMESLQGILCDLLNPVQRTLPSYRKVDLESYQIEPISFDNDAICKLTINFNIETILEVSQIPT